MSHEEYLGWIIEWGGNISTGKLRKRGIVIDFKKNFLVVIEENSFSSYSSNNLTIEVPINSRVIKIKPGDITDIQIKLNIEKRLKRLERNDPSTHDMLTQILQGLEKKGVNPEKTLCKAIENSQIAKEEVKLEDEVEKKRSSVVEIPIDDESGPESSDESDSDEVSDEEEGEDGEDDEDDEEEDDDEEEESDEGTGDEAEEVDDDEEDDEDDEDEEDEEDDDDEVEEEEEDDDEESEEAVDDEDSDSSSYDEDDDDRIDIKVYIHLPADLAAEQLPSVETFGTIDLNQRSSMIIRGFNMNRYKIMTKLTRLLISDYHRTPVLYYRDREDDEIMVSNQSDLKHILKLHEKEHRRKERKLKLIAKFPPPSPSKFHPQDKDKEEDSSLARGPWNISTNLLSHRWGEESRTQFDLIESKTTLMESFQTSEFIWQKGDLIGSGSFGQVYSAIHLSTGNQIAVKEVYLSNSKGHREQAEALQTEIKVLSSLDHPHIVKYYGAECTKDTLRIFLELASDGSVKDILNAYGGLPEPVLRRYTHDMLSGLLFLHSKGYIHRDIKPSNLLLDHNVVKLADFGCTTSVQVGQGGDNSNGHNTIIGTTIYMSPEVMRGNEETEDESAPIGYGRKADIWSVGITMVEMATGKLPFRNPASAIYTICVSKEYPTLPEEFSVEAHHFLSRCLVENPKDRASCEEIYEHSFCRPMTSMHPFQSNRTTTSTLLLLPEIDITDFSPRDVSPRKGNSFEGLDDSTGGSSLFLTAAAERRGGKKVEGSSGIGRGSGGRGGSSDGSVESERTILYQRSPRKLKPQLSDLCERSGEVEEKLLGEGELGEGEEDATVTIRKGRRDR